MGVKTEIFDPIKSPLNGRNLLEASAGTGKTFSVAVLTLRLVLDKAIPLNEVLMVTFTEAATAEMSERISLFIADAYRYAKGEAIGNPVIKEIVDNAKTRDGEQLVLSRLNQAKLLRDEINVFTIHSFCSQILKQEAFATGQYFTADVRSDVTEYIEAGIKEFWRNEVVTLDARMLECIESNSLFSLNSAIQVARSYQDRVTLPESEYFSNIRLSEFSYEEFDKIVKLDAKQREADIPARLYDAYQELLDGGGGISATARNNTIKKTNSLTGLIGLMGAGMLAPDPPQYYKTFNPSFLDDVKEVYYKHRKRPFPSLKLIGTILAQGALYADQFLQDKKKHLGFQTFNDMILDLYDVLRGGAQLSLDYKYKAVFVDEFQDTDPWQSYIFDQMFDRHKTVMFYVGDPKQSIYSFRGADLDSYKQVEVDRRYSMMTNYRSSRNFVGAMNDFFRAQDDFFKDDQIKYVQVEANRPVEDRANSAGMEVYQVKNKDEILQTFQAVMLDLLSGNHCITETQRPIVPGDVAVLVRNNNDADKVKTLLTNINVPSVILADRNIFVSEENRWVRYILEALIDGSFPAVKKCLSTPLIGLTSEEIKRLDPEEILSLYSRVKEAYSPGGVYAALMTFLNVFSVEARLIFHASSERQRILSNFKQLAELCNKKEREQSATLEDLVQWLVKNESQKESGEGSEQRIESDQKAVQIITIHKSKGLEYNVVVSYSMIMSVFLSKDRAYDYKDLQGKRWLSVNHANQFLCSKNTSAKDEENRRLAYVAITRARYKFVLIANITSGANKKHFISETLVQALTRGTQFIDFKPFPEDGPTNYHPKQEKLPTKQALTFFRTAFESGMSFASYSSLSTSSDHTSYSKGSDFSNSYDQFIFKDMPRGTTIGTFLHYLFEFVSFDAPDYEAVIKEGQSKFGSSLIKEEHIPLYVRLMKHTFGTKLPGLPISIGDIRDNKKLMELEFFLKVNNLDPTRIADEMKLPIGMKIDSYTGIINGLIDMIFEHEGKYYIVDWKSNYIGDQLADYSTDHLLSAMGDHNYHLQYYLYTKALTNYLSKFSVDYNPETDFGGVYYVFLRGCREGQESGVYAYRG